MRLRTGLLWLIALLCLYTAGLADQPVDPDRLRLAELTAQNGPVPVEALLSRAGYDIAFGADAPVGYGLNTFRTVVQDERLNGYSLQYEYVLRETSSRFGSYSTVIHQQQSASAEFPAELVAPGEYDAVSYIYALNGSKWVLFATRKVTFTLAADASHLSLEDTAAAVAAACRAGTDYETAYLLHDWLLNHAAYDYSYSCYGADGVLLRGRGTCDSFSKALVYLLEAAGIGVDRVEADAMNHAWNVVQLQGAWYQLDATWDETNSGGSASDGRAHRYCALPDTLMAVDHSYSCPVSCVSLACNYHVRMGGWETWAAGTLDSMESLLLRGGHDFSLTCDGTVRFAGASCAAGTGAHGQYFPILCHILNSRLWDLPDGSSASLSLTYDPVTLTWHVQRLDPPEGVLRLPAGLLRLEAEALAGEAANTVILPAGCVSIGSRVFDGGRLWIVEIPDSVTDIAADAFEGVPDGLIIRAPAGSSAAVFAETAGITLEPLSP